MDPEQEKDVYPLYYSGCDEPFHRKCNGLNGHQPIYNDETNSNPFNYCFLGVSIAKTFVSQ
jgi:hypothetical protein